MNNLLVTFIVLNIINVIIQTVKSIATIQCGKVGASVINAVAYGFYTIVTIYMLCDLPLMWKAGIVAACNLVGVYIVKWLEEKARKDKLWKIECSIKPEDFATIKEFGELGIVPFNYIDIGKYVIVNFYCKTQNESAIVRDLLNKYDAKYFVSESKNL
jgi:hypothetical protein